MKSPGFAVLAFVVTLLVSVLARPAGAQLFGVELHNTAMPASGGMAGTSVARPQDLTSAINGNPATLTQFQGTQFTFSGAWVEPTFNLQHDGGVLPRIDPFSAKSEAQGLPNINIGVTQDFSALGLPTTVGLGFFTAAAAGVDYNDVPASNGTSAALVAFEVTPAISVDLTDRISMGAALSLGIGIFDGPFVGLTALRYDYALRGSFGLDYDLTPETTLGVYYQTKQGFTFDDAIRLEIAPNIFDPIIRDIKIELPANIGFGVANNSLMDGRLLLAVDLLYKFWESADLFGAIYDNQFVFQAGAQFTSGRVRYRLGYAYAENPIRDIPAVTVGGVPLPGPAAANYVQAQLAVTNLHRLSMGMGIQDLLPGIDLDIAAGGMPKSSQDLGNLTRTALTTYWISLGITWRYGRGACEHGEWN